MKKRISLSFVWILALVSFVVTGCKQTDYAGDDAPITPLIITQGSPDAVTVTFSPTPWVSNRYGWQNWIQPVVNIPGITIPEGGIPCRNGEWADLQFGVTTEDEFAQWLQVSPYVDHDSLKSWNMGEEGVLHALENHDMYSWVIGEGEGISKAAVINVVDQTVYSLGSPLLYLPTIEDILEFLGEPEYLALFVHPSDSCVYSYNLYYPSEGILFNGADNNPAVCDTDTVGMLRMDESWIIDGVMCGQVGTLEEFLATAYGERPDTVLNNRDYIQPWPGFGLIKASMSE